MHVGIAQSRLALHVHTVAAEWEGREPVKSVAANESPSPWTGCDKKGEGCDRNKKKKECERQAELSEEVRVSSFEDHFPSCACESACLSPLIFVVLCD